MSGSALAPGLAAQTPTPQELARVSASGSYLAARHANQLRDAPAAAAYYRSVLRHDPRNAELVERAFFSVLAEGDIEEAIRLADRLVELDRNNRSARLVLGVRALKQKRYQSARTQFAQSIRGPITDLTATLLSAWALEGANDSKAAVELIDRLTGPDWYAIFKDLHAGMILDAAGKPKDAVKRLEKAYKVDQNALRVVESYGSFLARHQGKEVALKVYETFNKVLPNHPLVTDALAKLARGERIPIIAKTAQAGAAEALYGLGASLGRRGGEDLGLAYLQLALYLAPNHPLALLSLGDLYESMKNPTMAIKAYERVAANSPLRRNAVIQLALNLEALERTAEAKKYLAELIAEQPTEIEAVVALGNIERAHKEFAQCAQTYGKAIANIAKPERANWSVFYFRGICHERAKHWKEAELDLKKALELFPDQPHVLNYLGYSWVDQGINLEDGMRMIKRAVEQRPDDGYIVDSLGWAYYRTGSYDEAVKHLERAVELRPEDPTINDHLGDGYWQVGRNLEARFQWTHARDLKPEPDELVKIDQKLQHGLVDETSAAAAADKSKKPGDGG
ncbi:MAG: tetratricopeptide repeat protein [Proteobacteria bacterium]|nr:tetratricopeptide repeat protein [Pseudomonadota bacterium]